jgi:hypothetical protein
VNSRGRAAAATRGGARGGGGGGGVGDSGGTRVGRGRVGERGEAWAGQRMVAAVLACGRMRGGWEGLVWEERWVVGTHG